MYIERRDANYLNVVPTTLKQLTKTINLLYGEKMSTGKDIISIRLQHLGPFVYDSYINKYGLLNVAERKLKEVLLSAALNRGRLHKIELFARFIGLSPIQYSSDDLYFMFIIAQMLSYK